jgi:phosphinothricin acetyltransferase
MTPDDWPAVRAIYEEGIATKQATFETEAPDYATWDAMHLAVCRIVATMAGEVVGWAALLPASSRHVYRGVAEINVYVAEAHRGKHIGDALMARLVEQSVQDGIWTLQSVIFPENEATRRLHARHGFREVGHRERIGQMDREWRDTLLLERRSGAIS